MDFLLFATCQLPIQTTYCSQQNVHQDILGKNAKLHVVIQTMEICVRRAAAVQNHIVTTLQDVKGLKIRYNNAIYIQRLTI